MGIISVVDSELYQFPSFELEKSLNIISKSQPALSVVLNPKHLTLWSHIKMDKNIIDIDRSNPKVRSNKKGRSAWTPNFLEGIA